MKAKKKSSYDASEKFLEYQQFIVSHPAYAGMPDLYCEDGSIQWEAPSNRQSGQFKDTHDKRLLWWKKKAEEVGISVSENEWRSKVGLFTGNRNDTKRDEMKRKSIEMANKEFGLNLKWISKSSKKNEDDISDAILIAYSQIINLNT